MRRNRKPTRESVAPRSLSITPLNIEGHMRSRLAIKAIASALLISNIASPAARAEQIAILGPGTLSCSNWTTARNAPLTTDKAKMDRAGDEAWVIGFLSGASAYSKGKNSLHGLEAIDILVNVDDYCAAHPYEPMMNAAIAFMDSH